MLNYETILSSYDDKMTLMQWLKKVEEALKHASATAFRVNKKGNATISFILDFEDGTTLESGDIVLQQGESVNGAYIENNHLFITLTNGQVIDAGLMFNGDLTINGTLDATKVTGNEIVEKMSGYSMLLNSIENLTIENIYSSVVKTGNKLTIVSALNLTKTATLPSASVDILRIIIPAGIVAKLNPTIIGGYSALAYNLQKAIATGESYDVTNIIVKESYDELRLRLLASTINNLPLNTKVYYRVEVTFLLSDNLTGN